MSRIGKQIISIPSGVEVNLAGRDVSVKGKLGQLAWTIPHDIEGKLEGSELSFTPTKQKVSNELSAAWGLTRAKVNNMVVGVSEGFTKELEIRGVGYRANVQGKTLNLSLGHSHPVAMEISSTLSVEVNDNTNVVVKGFDKEEVGQFAANVRKKRPVEPYKGKGVRYKGEHVVMKEGKKK